MDEKDVVNLALGTITMSVVGGGTLALRRAFPKVSTELAAAIVAAVIGVAILVVLKSGLPGIVRSSRWAVTTLPFVGMISWTALVAGIALGIQKRIGRMETGFGAQKVRVQAQVDVLTAALAVFREKLDTKAQELKSGIDTQAANATSVDFKLADRPTYGAMATNTSELQTQISQNRSDLVALIANVNDLSQKLAMVNNGSEGVLQEHGEAIKALTESIESLKNHLQSRLGIARKSYEETT